MSYSTTDDDRVINSLISQGAALLRVYRNKRPAERRGWDSRQLPLSDALNWLDDGGLLAVQPHSLGISCLDVDEGDFSRIASAYPALAVCRTRLPDRRHLWYRSARQYAGRPWRMMGCSGEVRSGRGSYAILWAPSPLADALTSATESRLDFSAVWRDLQFTSASRGDALSHDGKGSLGRHETLKTQLIEARVSGCTATEIEDLAARLWPKIPQPPTASHPFPLMEARHLARWVGSMRWDTAAQSQRGRTAAVARRHRNGERDATIAALIADGLTYGEVAARLNIGVSTISRVLRARAS